jgi:Uncharacterized ACR, COG1753.
VVKLTEAEKIERKDKYPSAKTVHQISLKDHVYYRLREFKGQSQSFSELVNTILDLLTVTQESKLLRIKKQRSWV